MAEMDTLQGSLDGVLSAGDNEVSIAGEIASGPGTDQYSRIEWTPFDGAAWVSEQQAADGRFHHRWGGGPWVSEAPAASRSARGGQTLVSVMATITAVREIGTVVEAGRTLYRLRPAHDFLLYTSALGLTHAGMRDAWADVEFLANADGAPIAFAVTATRGDQLGSDWVQTGLDIRLTLQRVDRPAFTRPPGGAWEGYQSADHHVSVGHPPGWAIDLSPDGDVLWSADNALALSVSSADGARGAPLEFTMAVIVQEMRSTWAFGDDDLDVGTSEPVLIEGQEAQIVSLTDPGSEAVIHAAFVIVGDRIHTFALIAVEDAGDDRLLFDDFLTTVHFGG